MRMTEQPASQEIILLAAIADRIEMFRYGFADKKEATVPVSIVESLYGGFNKNGKEVKGFSTPEEFEAALAKIRGE